MHGSNYVMSGIKKTSRLLLLRLAVGHSRFPDDANSRSQISFAKSSRRVLR